MMCCMWHRTAVGAARPALRSLEPFVLDTPCRLPLHPINQPQSGGSRERAPAQIEFLRNNGVPADLIVVRTSQLW